MYGIDRRGVGDAARPWYDHIVPLHDASCPSYSCLKAGPTQQLVW